MHGARDAGYGSCRPPRRSCPSGPRALDEAWEGRRRRHVVPIVAIGGSGKTTLVFYWLMRLKERGYRGARRVFAWSFFSQGSGVNRSASSDPFIAAALRFFGDPDPT